jgi:Kef-type K+ transport system membrane component KefB
VTIEESAKLFITLGATFLIGLAAHAIGARTRLPRVTLLLVLGFLIGPACLDFLPESRETMFQLAANIALTLVGFLLGEKLGETTKGDQRREILTISAVVVVATAVLVFSGLVLIGSGVVVALFLAAAATATDPAATSDVIVEMKAKGPFSKSLLAIVAVDDAWGLLVFCLALAGAEVLTGNSSGAIEPLMYAARDIGGALLLGSVLGVAMAYLTGRIKDGEPTVLEAIGFVFLACGLSLWLDVSFILTAMTMGVIVSRLAKHHARPFHVIEHIELPFMIVFFVLAGASLEIDSLAEIGWIGLAYIALRAVGRVVGGWLGATLSGADHNIRHWIGLALMPQAGVALGMVLVGADRVPSVGPQILQITIGATVVFEIVGPLLTRWAVLRADGSAIK